MQEYFPVICMAFFSVDKYYAKVVEDLSQGKHRGE
jgi:GPH family glycoside/pentoside/hexuronide:cation symporter